MNSTNTVCTTVTLRRMLLKLGATPRYIGFDYLIYAVTLSLNNRQYLLSVTKELYPTVAKHYHTTIYSVERDIRTVITAIWKRNPNYLQTIAGYPLEKKPSVGEFIAILREYLMLNQLEA